MVFPQVEDSGVYSCKPPGLFGASKIVHVIKFLPLSPSLCLSLSMSLSLSLSSDLLYCKPPGLVGASQIVHVLKAEKEKDAEAVKDTSNIFQPSLILACCLSLGLLL